MQILIIELLMQLRLIKIINSGQLIIFFPRDKKSLKPGKDLLIEKYGQGPTHSLSERVERLVEYKIKNDRIVLTNNPHIEIELEGEKTSRKWEALARYENKGFLIATDKYPKPNTILAYIPYD